MKASSMKIIPHVAELRLSLKEPDACYVVLLAGVCGKTLVRDLWQCIPASARIRLQGISVLTPFVITSDVRRTAQSF